MARKRADGEGMIRKRPDGKWEARTPRDAAGRRRKIVGPTQSDVRERLQVLLRQQAQGVNLHAERLTVAQFLQQWLDQAIKPHRRPRTVYSYTNTIRLHIAPHIGTIDVRKLTPVMVQRMINALVEDEPTRTAQYARSVLSRALNVAVKWDIVPRNVVAATSAPRVEKRPIQPLTKEQVRALLDALIGHRLEALYRVALALGLRRGEILGLLWSEIDLVAGTLRISGALQRVDGKLERTPTKTKSSARELPLPPSLVAVLKAHWTRQQAERLKQGADWQEHGLVFPGAQGRPMEPAGLNQHFTRLKKRIGLPATLRIHDLRHSCATMLLLQGVDARTIADILGHARVSTTLDIYVHSNDEARRAGIGIVEGLLKKEA